MHEDPTLPATPADDDRTALESEGAGGTAPAGAPAVIGPYRLLRRVGEGGMGEVWEAEQREPIRRRVAIKLVKVGMDSRDFVRRFEAERQMLALMDHPAIARVIDGGATATGRPYLVMEFVEGEPITRHCDRHRLSTRARLALFLEVCDGVEHAHRRGILHRDLKPSNVLIADQDGRPQPKIIDFGLAKAIAGPVAEHAVRTLIGGWLGTPAYMSPEQADGRGDIDTRTDVYSLGVMLYELVAGVRPLSTETIESAGPGELGRLLSERVLPSPSSRLSALGSESATIAAARSTDPRALERSLRGDLDWIALKAIEPDRDRRYGSPSRLAEDIRRHLRSEPVVARPPSVRYRAGRFVRRHRVGVAAATVAVAGLVAAIVGTGIGLVRAQRAEAEAVAAAERASREAATANRVTEFLVDLFGATDPDQARGDTVTAREVLDRGAARVEQELAGEPVVRARLLRAIAEVYEGLGLYEQARPLYLRARDTLERELGPDDPLTLSAAAGVGGIEWRLGRYETAEPELERTLEAARRLLGHDHPLALRTQGNLASLFFRRNELERAEALYRDAWESFRRIDGDDAVTTLGALNNLANAVEKLGRRDEAIGYFETVLERRRATQGSDHPDALGAALNLASAYEDAGRLDEAEALTDSTLRDMERVLGEDHPDTITLLNNAATIDVLRGRYPEAIAKSRKVVEVRTRVLGPLHDQTLIARRNLAHVLQDTGDLAGAEREFRAAIAGLEQRLGPDAYMTLDTRAALAVDLAFAGRNAEAERELEAILPDYERVAGPSHPRVLEALYNLACVETRLGDHDQALAHLGRAVEGGNADPSMLEDPDLAPLRSDPRWQPLAERMRTAPEG